MFVCMYLHERKTSKKEAINLKESGKEHMGRFGRRKGTGAILELYFNLKNKKNWL